MRPWDVPHHTPLPAAGRGLVLATALLTVAPNPAVFSLADRLTARAEANGAAPPVSG